MFSNQQNAMLNFIPIGPDNNGATIAVVWGEIRVGTIYHPAEQQNEWWLNLELTMPSGVCYLDEPNILCHSLFAARHRANRLWRKALQAIRRDMGILQPALTLCGDYEL